MSPLWWLLATGPQRTVMLDTLTADALTDVGGADGTGGEVEKLPTRINILQVTHTYFTYTPPIQPEIT